MGEFELIDRIRSRVAAGPEDSSVVIGIGDDGAVIRPEPGYDLVATTDTLVAGRHFSDGFPPAAIGHLALAVNLSDIAAMGAIPRWALLSLTLPEARADWIDGFLDGFLPLCESAGVTLTGGNIASGPLSITVQVLGQVEPGKAVTRSGGRVGDRVVVTGTIGDAAGALELGHMASGPGSLFNRLAYPVPRLSAGRCLAGRVHALADISDGLLADLGHLLGDGLGAELELASLPTSRSLADHFPEPQSCWPLQLAGGGDYELIGLVPEQSEQLAVEACKQVDVELTVIGRVSKEPGIRCLRPDGSLFEHNRTGWDHFHGP